MTDTAVEFSHHVTTTEWDSLSSHVVERTIHSIIDTVGVILAGSATTDVLRIVDAIQHWGGRPESTIAGHGIKAPAPFAVLANAAMAHQHDFDDTHDAAVCHPTSASLSAALAVAEARGGVHGRELISAVAIGNDVTCRLGLALRGSLWDYHWVRAPVVGMFGAVAAAGRVAGLDAAQLRHAWGLGLAQVAGTLECLEGSGSSVRSIRDGFAYKDAVVSVELAARGLRGDQGVFDGRHGLYQAYFRGDYDRAVLTDELGDRFEGAAVSLKPWPSCRHTHATLTALLDLLAEVDAAGLRVDRVVVHIGDGNRRITEGQAAAWPSGHIDALCNLPFVVSVALAHRTVPIAAFEDEHLDDPAVLAERRRISFVHSPEQNAFGTIEPGWVELHLSDGTVRERRVERALGHPLRPLDESGLRAKFVLCAELASIAVSPDAADRMFDRLLDLASHGAVHDVLDWGGPSQRDAVATGTT